MNFYKLSPEVAGGLGKNTVFDRSQIPPRIKWLHYVIEGWLGDELLESYPCFLISESLAEKLLLLGATGFDLHEAEVTTSEQFKMFHPEAIIPKFLWLDVFGKPRSEDCGVDERAVLYISERVLACLRKGRINNCIIEPA